ncbi:MAG: hypothetical protein LBT25_05155 [Candidatus Symbiothrix sp.]|jgi:hypothetical protein|nr:hypothetical protein [Candidatus Symbiothrix sp.]
MSTSAQKLSLIRWITELKDVETLKAIEIIKDSNIQDDWWNKISVVEKMSIGQGLSDAKEGKTTLHSDVKKRYEKWLL